LQNARYADKVICDSQENQTVLRDRGLMVPAVVVPLAAWFGASPPLAKPSFSDGVLRLAFIGRLVQSKGPMDLLALVRHLLRETAHTLRVEVLFNSELSDPAMIEAVDGQAKAIEAEFRGRVVVALHPNGENSLKERVLADADLFCLPTKHEGFCVPIIEAMAAGCRVLSYVNSNVPYISGGLAELAPDGDLAAFVRLGAELVNRLAAPEWHRTDYANYAERALGHVKKFSEINVKERFLAVVGATLIS